MAAAGLAGALCCGQFALDGLHAEAIAILSERALASGSVLKAQDAARRALAVRPREYRYLELAARSEDGLARPQHALVLWQSAVLARPNWAYAWARLAHWQLRAGADPVALERTLSAVARYGEYERGLWRFFALLALAHEDSVLRPSARNFLDERLARELHDHPQNLMGHALQSRREEKLCRFAAARDGVQPDWCGKVRYVRQICEGTAARTFAQDKWCGDMAAFWRSLDYPPG